MKFTIFTGLLIAVSFTRAQTGLLQKDSTLLPSAIELSKKIPSLVKDPVGAVLGLGTLVPTALTFSISVGQLSNSVDDFSEFITKSPSSANAAFTQNLDCLMNNLDDLIVASYNFSQSIDEQTTDGTLNFFDFGRVPKTLIELTNADNGVSSCIQDKIEGITSGSSASLNDFTEKIHETAKAQGTFADVANPVHGVTGLVAGAAALLLGIAANFNSLSRNLYKFADSISELSDPSFSDLASAVKYLADEENRVSVAFYRLSDLT